VVDAFLAASRGGDFAALLELLDPGVELRTDAAAARIGAPGELRGARAIAEVFTGRAQAAQPAFVDGAAALVWAPDGRARVVFRFRIDEDRIVGIEMVADSDRIAGFALTFGDR
jgi:RNA polymerase sigma-70 factor (ECF subfamily)